MHPLDIHMALFATHAQRVVLIHFAIALFIIGVLFDFLGHWKGKRVLVATAYYNFLVAAIATVLVVVTGIPAWQWELEVQKLRCSLDASRDDVRFDSPDLGRLVHAHENVAPTRTGLGWVSPANRGRGEAADSYGDD